VLNAGELRRGSKSPGEEPEGMPDVCWTRIRYGLWWCHEDRLYDLGLLFLLPVALQEWFP